MKIPTADHPIRIKPASGRVRARAAGHVVADSGGALMLEEADYPPVAYLPRADVEMSFFTKTERKTTCPYKGEASYYSLHIEGRIFENVAWSYETPYPAVSDIKARLAFYKDQVEIYAVDPKAVGA